MLRRRLLEDWQTPELTPNLWTRTRLVLSASIKSDEWTIVVSVLLKFSHMWSRLEAGSMEQQKSGTKWHKRKRAGSALQDFSSPASGASSSRVLAAPFHLPQLPCPPARDLLRWLSVLGNVAEKTSPGQARSLLADDAWNTGQGFCQAMQSECVTPPTRSI